MDNFYMPALIKSGSMYRTDKASKGADSFYT